MPSAPIEEAKLERIDPATGAVDRTFDDADRRVVRRRGGGALWSTGYLGGHVRGAARSDAATGAMRRVDIGIYGDLSRPPTTPSTTSRASATASPACRRKTGKQTNEMTLVTDASLAAGNVPANPTGVAVGGGSVWISESDGSVLRVDPKLGGIAARIPACSNALARRVRRRGGVGGVRQRDGRADRPATEPGLGGRSGRAAAARDRRRRGRRLGDAQLMSASRWRRWWSERGLPELRLLAIEHWDPVNVYDDPANADALRRRTWSESGAC